MSKKGQKMNTIEKFLLVLLCIVTFVTMILCTLCIIFPNDYVLGNDTALFCLVVYVAIPTIAGLAVLLLAVVTVIRDK